MGSSDEFDVVVICSGNRFRSPIAEAILRREIEGLPVRVRSFGTMDLPSGHALSEAIESRLDHVREDLGRARSVGSHPIACSIFPIAGARWNISSVTPPSKTSS